MKKEIKNIASITSIDDRDMTRAVIARADEAISELQARLSSAELRVTSAVNELASIPQDRQRRMVAFNQAKEAVIQLRDKIGHAEALLRLYTGTPMERAYLDDVDALRAELVPAEKLLHETEKVVNDRGFNSNAREQELTELIDFKLKPEIVSLQTELKHLQAAREQARRKLAEQDCIAILQEYGEYNKRIEEIEADLIAAKQDRQTFVKEHINEFREWRDLNTDVRAKLLLEDTQTRQLESYIAFLEAFLKDRLVLTRQLPVHVPLLAPSHLDNWTHLFSLGYTEWYYEDWRRADLQPKTHQARLDLLRDVLTRYRQWLAKG